MEDLVRLALGKGIKVTDAVRDAVRPGSYPVDALVRVKGTVKVGEDSEFTPTVAIPIKATLALFVRYCGVTRDAALKVLERAMREAIELDEKGADTIAEAVDIAETERRVVEMLGTLPKKPRKGAVTVKFSELETVEA